MKYSFGRDSFARWRWSRLKVFFGSFLAGSITLGASHAGAAILYVNANGNNPMPPYADWDTAATNIQNAVDAANTGDLVMVTNGVYQTDGRLANGATLPLTNRVAIDKALTVQSVNGPAVTIIEGYQVPGTTNGPSAVRGVYVGDGATLAGFTIEHGATLGPVNPETTNAENHGGGVYCQSTNATVSNCIIVSNFCTIYGAGAYSGTLSGCQINYNAVICGGSAGGGAVAFSRVTDSTINNNSFIGGGGELGGGAYSCILSNCAIDENLRGGVFRSSLDHCTVANNTNGLGGGGAMMSVLNACLVNGNQSSSWGGGVYDCTLNTCTLSNNWSATRGGAVYYDFFQTNAPGDNNILVGNTCGQLGGGLYLSTGSANQNWNITGWSFLTNSAVQDGGGFYLTSLSSGISNCTFAGNMSGGNGGGFCPSSSGSPIHIRNSTLSGNTAQGNGGGAYNAALDDCFVSGNQATNGGGVYGYVSNCVVNGNSALANGGGLYLFDTTTRSPNCRFTNNSAMNGGAAYGGIFTNCVFAGNSAMTNGGAVVIAALNHCLVISNQAAFGGGSFAGGGAPFYPGTSLNYIQCDFIGNSASGDGGGSYGSASNKGTNCNFIGNSALNNGGGIYSGSLSYCIISDNTAGANGGGSYNASLINSLAIRNSAANGGGAYLGSLNNSTIAGNDATVAGGGIYFMTAGTIVSCIIYDNTAPAGQNYSGSPSFSFCCTTPLPPFSSQSITNDPAFIDFGGANFRLQTNSPCINLGVGSPGNVDLDGRQRFVGRIDIGAYEFKGPGIGEFTAWLQQHGLPANGSADFLDSDADGMNNWNEWISGTDPTSSFSVLKMMTPTFTQDLTGTTLTWQSVSNRTYFLQRSGDLLAQPAFSTIQSNIIGQSGTTSYTDTNSVETGPFFYRIGIQ